MNFARLLFASVLGFCCLTSLGRPIAVEAGEEQFIAGAKQEGEVSLYLSTNLTNANGMIQRFNQKYPFVKVNLFRADNRKTPGSNLTEASDGKFSADVILISSFEVRVLMQRKLLQKIPVTGEPVLSRGLHRQGRLLDERLFDPRVMAYNTKLVRPDAARNLEDLLQPKWKQRGTVR